MKILVINPNSSEEMTAAIQKVASNFAAGDFEVTTVQNPGAPEFIETYEDQVKTVPGIINIIRSNEDSYDAFVLACHCDPQLDVCKEITKKPVVGIGEASMKIASMLGHRFSVVSTAKHSIPNKEALVHKYFLDGVLASVKAPPDDAGDCSVEEKTFLASKAAIEEDMAEVIVLGCAGFAGLDKRLQEKLAVPVLDSVVCGLIVAVGLAKYGISTSKIRRYNLEH